MLALPIIGIIGYYTEVEWLYYLCSILTFIATLTMIFSKRLTQTMFEIFIVLIIGFWILSSSFIDGLLLGSCAFVIISNVITIYKSMYIFHSFQKKYVDKKSDKDDDKFFATIFNKSSQTAPKVEKYKWVIKDERPFTQEEIAAVDSAMVVPCQNGFSVQFTLVSGGFTFIPLDHNSELCEGELVDLTKAKVVTLSKHGEGDIYRIKD